MEPEYHFPSYELGAPTSPQTANQLEQFGSLLNQGIKNIEVGTLAWETFETIPKQHLEDIRRLSKITGSKVSLHSPIQGIEPAGFTQQGWSEESRRANEAQIWNVVERAHELDNTGNVPIALHGSNIMGAEWEADLKRELERKGKKEFVETPRMMSIVNQDNGQMHQLQYEKKYHIGEEKAREEFVEDRLDNLNQTQWDQEKLKVMSYSKEMVELDGRKNALLQQVAPLEYAAKNNLPLTPEERQMLAQIGGDLNLVNSHIHELRRNAHSEIAEMFNRVKKFEPSKEDHPDRYRDFERFKKDFPEIEERYKKVDEEMRKIQDNFGEGKYNPKETAKQMEILNSLSEERDKMLFKTLTMMPTPEVWRPVNKFAIDKVSDTIAKVALKSYEKFKDTAPIIAIENSYPHAPLGRANELREGIEKSREKFVEQLTERNKNITKSEARKIAEKIIGATWDVGHINMLRKGGYTEEQMLKEAREIAPFVKHVHINDNFGFGDVHLPIGMGTSPIKEQLKILEKSGASPEKIRKIVEAGGFAAQFKESPWPYALESFDSPLYTLRGAPYWSSVREAYAPYRVGYGEMLPDVHFNTYGGGFSSLPSELGGQIPGSRSRFTGTPTE